MSLQLPYKHSCQDNIDLYFGFGLFVKGIRAKKPMIFRRLIIVAICAGSDFQGLDSNDLTCDKCVDEFNWKICKHFGAMIWFDKDGKVKKNKNMLEEMYVSQLSEFRQTVIAPMLANSVV